MQKLFIAIVAVTALGLAPSAMAYQLVPAYFYPSGTPNPWHTMCENMDSAGYGSTAIMNPDNGPGPEKGPSEAEKTAYTKAIEFCQNEGQNVIGYVYTQYTKRNLKEVENAVSDYYSWYPEIQGIFVDEMAQAPLSKAECTECTGMTVEGYYKTLYTFIHEKGGPASGVIGNPGAAASTAWQLDAPAADEVVTFEGTGTAFAAYKPPQWVIHKSPEEIGTIIYDVSGTTQMEEVCAKAEEDDNAGLIYITDHPYDELPSYWLTEAERCG
jgi:hypothetical protein